MKKDVIYNQIAVALPILLLQVVVLPLVNRGLGPQRFGSMLTLIAVLNVVAVVFGNALCNARQILEGGYRVSETSGDFALLVIGLGALSSLFTFVIALAYGASAADAAFLCLASAAMFLYNYGIVAFRIEVDFRGMLWASLVLASGLLIGLLIFALVGLWQSIFIVGYGFAVGFIALKTSLLSEPINITPKFKSTARITTSLVAALSLASLLSYADRLILYPLLGAEAVGIYFIASLIGRILVMAISPMAAVILSYKVREADVNVGRFREQMLTVSAVGLVFCVLAWLIAPWVLGLLYPNEKMEALRYVPVLTIVSVVQSVTSLLNPTLMRFFRAGWQVVINGFAVALLLGLGWILAAHHGLFGFCWAALVAALVKLVFVSGLVLKGDASSKYATLS